MLICTQYVTDGVIQRAAAIMLLKAREKHRIPLSVMDAIVNDVQSLFDIVNVTLSTRVQTYLQSVGASEEAVEGIHLLFNNCPRLFEGLQTQQQQLSFFHKNFHFIVRRVINVFSDCFIIYNHSVHTGSTQKKMNC